jgi:hypothetical protein
MISQGTVIGWLQETELNLGLRLSGVQWDSPNSSRRSSTALLSFIAISNNATHSHTCVTCPAHATVPTMHDGRPACSLIAAMTASKLSCFGMPPS